MESNTRKGITTPSTQIILLLCLTAGYCIYI